MVMRRERPVALVRVSVDQNPNEFRFDSSLRPMEPSHDELVNLVKSHADQRHGLDRVLPKPRTPKPPTS